MVRLYDEVENVIRMLVRKEKISHAEQMRCIVFSRSVAQEEKKLIMFSFPEYICKTSITFV